MLNINRKLWSELKNSDVKEFLSTFTGEADNDENFFFEFKSANVDNTKIINEVCAFSNTYGGYIFIGISDSKNVVGCSEWTEERIQNLICDRITPLPSFDVRRFVIDNKPILIVKINEGSRPPYITNRGEIYERVSSGCRKLVDADRLSTIYKRNQEQQERLEIRLRNESINDQRNDFPNNIVAILDIGFETITNDILDFQKDFYVKNPTEILKRFNEEGITSLYRIGNTYNISYGSVSQSIGNVERDTMLGAGLNNYMVVYSDGAAKIRCILNYDNYGNVNIDTILLSLATYRKVYEFLFPDLWNKYVYASKYEQLHVLKSFCPQFSASLEQKLSECSIRYENDNQSKRIIYTGGRVPSYGFSIIDKAYLNCLGDTVASELLFEELFRSSYTFMGLL